MPALTSKRQIHAVNLSGHESIYKDVTAREKYQSTSCQNHIYPASRPIDCPPMMALEHQEEMLAQEQEKAYYDACTWSMYRRITAARSARNARRHRHRKEFTPGKIWIPTRSKPRQHESTEEIFHIEF